MCSTSIDKTNSFFDQVTRRLILMRHAQTAVKQAGQHDSDRTLTIEGEAQARNTGQYFVLNSFLPDFVLSSGAARARETSRLILEAASVDPGKLRTEDKLYEADIATWLSQIRLVPAAANTVLCVGHNPVLSGLASVFLSQSIDLAPAGFVVIETTAPSWSEFDGSMCVLLQTKSLS